MSCFFRYLFDFNRQLLFYNLNNLLFDFLKFRSRTLFNLLRLLFDFFDRSNFFCYFFLNCLFYNLDNLLDSLGLRRLLNLVFSGIRSINDILDRSSGSINNRALISRRFALSYVGNNCLLFNGSDVADNGNLLFVILFEKLIIHNKELLCKEHYDKVGTRICHHCDNSRNALS